MKRIVFAATTALALSGAAAFAQTTDVQVAPAPLTAQATPEQATPETMTSAQGGAYVEPSYEGSSRETYYQENMGENPVRNGGAIGLFPPSDGNG